MEDAQNVNTCYITNRSDQPLTIVVEPIHYVEKIQSGQALQVRAVAPDTVSLLDLFDVEYYEGQIVVLLNSNMDFSGSYKLSVHVDDKEVFAFQL